MQQSDDSSPTSCKLKHSWVAFLTKLSPASTPPQSSRLKQFQEATYKGILNVKFFGFCSPAVPGGGIGGGGKPGGPGNGGGGGSPPGKLPGGGNPGGRCIPAGGAPSGCGGGGWYDIVPKRKTNFEELLKEKVKFWLSPQHGRPRVWHYKCMVGRLVPSSRDFSLIYYVTTIRCPSLLTTRPSNNNCLRCEGKPWNLLKLIGNDRSKNFLYFTVISLIPKGIWLRHLEILGFCKDALCFSWITAGNKLMRAFEIMALRELNCESL